MSENAESARLVAALDTAHQALKGEYGPFLSTAIGEALPNIRLMFPELIAYRGGLFIAEQFDQTTVDDLFDMAAFGSGGSAVRAAEEAVNSVGLFAHSTGPGDVKAAEAAILAFEWVWTRWLRETYGVAIEVLSSIDAEEGAHVTFHSVSGA